MKINSGIKTKNTSQYTNNNYYLTPTKRKASNGIASIQTEDKPNDCKQMNHFNSSKGKVPYAPFIINKQTRNHDPIYLNSKLGQSNPNQNPREIAPVPQPNVNSTNFIPLLKYASPSIENVSKLLSTHSMTNLYKNNQNQNDEKKLIRSESSANLKRTLIRQLVRNESQNSLNKNGNDDNKDSGKANTSPSLSNVSSPIIHRCASSKTIPKGNIFMDQEPIIDKQVIITSEDLLLIEDKLRDILMTIEKGFTISNECFEWWNFYFSSSIAGNYVEYFINEKNQKKIRAYVNIELLCMMVCYYLSFNNDIYQQYLNDLKTIISFLHFNLLLMIKFIMIIQKVHDYSYIKLDLMLKKSLSKIQKKDVDEFFIASVIDHNMTSVGKIYKSIVSKEFIELKEKQLKSFFSNSYEKRDIIPVKVFNEFFRFNMIKVSNPEGSVLASSIKGANPIPVRLKVPYLPIMIHFKYTLVLDLDETLIHLKEDYKNPSNNKLLLRPGLFQFLQKMKNRYELIVFTVGTKCVRLNTLIYHHSMLIISSI